MRAGELDRRITIEVNAPTRSASGAAVDSWSAFATVWAKRRDVGGREIRAGAEFVGEIDAVFTVRWLAGVTDAMRVDDDGTLFDIKWPRELGRRSGLEILAVAQGV